MSLTDVALVGPVYDGMENLSLAALRGAVRDAGGRVSTSRLRGFGDLGRAAAEVIGTAPAICGISIQTSEAALASVTFARLLRRRGFRGHVVCGGHFATLHARELLEQSDAIDAVVRFAGEEALGGLVRGAIDWHRLPGMTFRGSDGATRTGATPRMARGLVGARRDEPLPEHLGWRAADLVLSGGCEATCAYCCVAGATRLARAELGEHEGVFERLTVDGIAEEIARLWHEQQARVFNVMDDNLLPLDPVAAEAFARALTAALRRRRVGRIALSLQLRADAVVPGVADALAELGLVRAYLGVDGVSAPQLKALGRRARPQDAQRALAELRARGIYAVVNALLVGPTIPFESVEAEVSGLATLRGGAVHLLPTEVRGGTELHRRAERLGLLEGGFLHRHVRFVDPRTEALGRLLTGLPTRLTERSVPIALYDLGYNLGIAQRLCPEASLVAVQATWERVTRAWNDDQGRLLARAVATIEQGGPDALRHVLEVERARTRHVDEALRGACDDALRLVERAVSTARRSQVRAHSRGRLLGAIVATAALGACDCGYVAHTPDAGAPADAAVDASFDASVDAASPRDAAPGLDAAPDAPPGPCPDGRGAQEHLEFCCWDYTNTTVRLTFDADGVLESVEPATDGGPLDAELIACVQQELSRWCYPSLANTSTELQPHCWIA